MAERIFVQMPAYRDRELLPTLDHLLRNAAQPQRLRVVIAWQYGQDEAALVRELTRWPQVELIQIPAKLSQGVNWARELIQRRYDGEPYTLLLDSHHRFAPRWDERLVSMHRALCERGVAKPIVTAYLPPYQPANDPAGRTSCVFKIALHERRQGLAFLLRGHAVPQWRCLSEPQPAHFASLHFLFAPDSFMTMVPIDPSLYFFADEIAIALRAFTHGYDLFHPHELLGWHLYDRATRATHWSDHADWRWKHEATLDRLAALYSGQIKGRYGIGSVRSVSEFEAHIGLRLTEQLDLT